MTNSSPRVIHRAVPLKNGFQHIAWCQAVALQLFAGSSSEVGGLSPVVVRSWLCSVVVQSDGLATHSRRAAQWVWMTMESLQKKIMYTAKIVYICAYQQCAKRACTICALKYQALPGHSFNFQTYILTYISYTYCTCIHKYRHTYLHYRTRRR